jgi:hypothetical protein
LGLHVVGDKPEIVIDSTVTVNVDSVESGIETEMVVLGSNRDISYPPKIKLPEDLPGAYQ